MKSLLRNIFINFLCLFSVSEFTKSINYSHDYVILFSAAFYLTVFNLLIKPLLNLLLLPINLITLGAFRWIINVLVLLLVTLFVPGFKITGFAFPGLSLSGFVIPPISLSFIWSMVLVSFLIELSSSIINWIFK